VKTHGICGGKEIMAMLIFFPLSVVFDMKSGCKSTLINTTPLTAQN